MARGGEKREGSRGQTSIASNARQAQATAGKGGGDVRSGLKEGRRLEQLEGGSEGGRRERREK